MRALAGMRGHLHPHDRLKVMHAHLVAVGVRAALAKPQADELDDRRAALWPEVNQLTQRAAGGLDDHGRLGIAQAAFKDGDASCIDDLLGQLGGVLTDVAERGGGDSLQSQLGLLEAQNQEGDRLRAHDGLRELLRVPSNVSQSPRRGFFDRRVELF